ncbi:hypothetical protein P43SY_005185 [Pythium insidiosum]|uniref:TKL protein kinase n=1 Tax=Pythium insidiosum TaxID=114742 RepID=A0AAD5LR57_PYTIN|nr:hypothetical protein P43SY_005185 [Pythium insidiosum]
MLMASRAERPLCISLPTRVRCAVWLLLVAVHVLVTSFLALHATFYLACLSWPRVRYFAATYQLLSSAELPLAAGAYIAMALAFVVSLLRSLRGYRRRYVRVVSQPSRAPSLRQSSAHSAASRRSGVATITSYARDVTGFLSFNGDGYEVGTTLRGALQVTFQSLQAYDFSRSTPTLSLNVAFSTLVLVSSVAMPVVELAARHDLARRRFWMLLVDLALDLAWLALPMLLWPKYLGDFFNEEVKYYEDTYNSRALMELQLVSAHSFGSVLVKMLPCLGLLVTFSKIRTSVLTRPERVLSSWSSFSSRSKTTFAESWLWKTKRALDSVLAVWGVCVAVISLVAYASPPPQCQIGCELVLRPWFLSPSHCRCAVQQINCHRRGLRGGAEELTHWLRQLDPDGLSSLIFMHCPSFEMPAMLHSFPDLYALEIYNSSIAAFDERAAISSAHFRRLATLTISRSNLTEIPMALRVAPLPSRLQEIAIIVSEISSLPDDLDSLWPNVRTFYLEHSRLRSFPTVLGRLRLETLSLYNNSIAEIPGDALRFSRLVYLLLNRNPLGRLPATLGDASGLYDLQLQFTNVSSISPDWVARHRLQPSLRLFAMGSPLCANVSGRVPLAHGVELRCDPHAAHLWHVYSYSYYPLEAKTQERQPR